MKRRIPIWLLRDVPAFVAVMATFWPLMILVILNGWKAMSGAKVDRRVYDRIQHLLAKAESRLDHALWRQAYRACGYDPRYADFIAIPPPTSWAETSPRFQAYRNAFRNMEAIAHAYAQELRRRYGAAHGSTAALRAARHELVGVSTTGLPFTFMVSSAQGARPSNHAGEPRAKARAPPHVRGPPLFATPYSLFAHPYLKSPRF